MIGQSETGSSSQIISIILFSGRCQALLCLLPASANCAKMLVQSHYDLSSSNFNLQCHILSTSGVALLNPALYHESVMAQMDITWDSHLLTSCFLQGTLTFKDRQLRKFFKTGDHVKVIAGKHEGATGMIVKIKNNVITLLSDTTREDVSTSTLLLVSKLVTDSQERMKKIEF
jgi:hypothetical protein